VTSNDSVFDPAILLPVKASPVLIESDERHFNLIRATLERSTIELTARLAGARRAPAVSGSEVLERDMEIRRLAMRLRTLGRYGLDLCLGRIVPVDGSEPVYIGRLGLTDTTGNRLLVDWRSPAAEPFFGATHADPMGLASRRRYRWTRGRIGDYWDEVFTPELFDGGDALENRAALDDQSAFIVSLGSSRSNRMRDVLSTIQADQDAIIRAGSRGAMVVDGGPGTGKTVVALHRTAYLLYSDPRLDRHRGGVLFVGPSNAYLNYVDDVLPSLGEEGVQICTLRDLLPEGDGAAAETDTLAARIKASSEMVTAIDTAVHYYERPPTAELMVETEWDDILLDADDWANAFDAAERGVPHNEARDQVWEELLAILLARHDGDAPEGPVRRALQQNAELRAAFTRAWPLLDQDGVLGDLWSIPAYLRACAPWLDAREISAVQREDARAWTLSDMPLLDAARHRIGDPEATRRRHRRDAAVAVERERVQRVVDDILAAEDDFEGEVQLLRQQQARDALIDPDALPSVDPDLLAGPFAHIVVDEAQELTDAEWGMLLRRCPSKSFTIVGDRAQARHGFAESWRERLERIGVGDVTVASLTINYRTPEEVMAEAEPVIRAVLPDANVPTSIRRSGLPVLRGANSDLKMIVETWLDDHAEGIIAVISTDGAHAVPRHARVRSLTPELSKGLEFDLVVVVDSEGFGDGIEGAVDRYVAMTRATQQLVTLTRR
jgi:DNA helicase IV